MADAQFLPLGWIAYSIPFAEFGQSLPSRIKAISPFVRQFMRFVLNCRAANGSELEIETAVREALANAVIHGNGQNPCKRVHMACRCYVDGELFISVRDEGQGFESSAVPDPTAAENLLLTHGRGIYLMKALMDEVSFEKHGTVVHMRKKSPADSAAKRRGE